MSSVQSVIQRHTPIALQNLALSVRGFQLNRFRYSAKFHQRLAELEKSAAAPIEQLWEIQSQRLKERVRWAREKVPYYADLAPPSEKGDPEEAIAETLASIPKLEKHELATDLRRFLGRDLWRWRLIGNSTSGTTGTALDLWHTRAALAEEYATVWRMYRRHGVQLNDWRVTFGGNTVVPFESDDPPFWRTNHYGRQVLFSVYHMKPENMGVYVSQINKVPARWVQGYPSSLVLMAHAMLDAGRPLPKGRLLGVFTSSEQLLAYHREVIEEAFNAPVVNRYGTSEFAVSMSSCPAGMLHVDMEFCIVEVEPIEEDDRRVRGPLFITGLAPDAIPFLRYRIGDIGTKLKAPCPCGRPGEVFEEVEGREDDFVLTPDGRMVGRLDHVFKGQVQIAEAQIVQEDTSSISVYLVARRGYDANAERSLVRKLRERLGNEIHIHLHRIRAIPRDANGKFRSVKSKVGSLRPRDAARPPGS